MIKTCMSCGEKFETNTKYDYAGSRKNCFICRPHQKTNTTKDTIRKCVGDCGRTLPNTRDFFYKQGKYLSPKCKYCAAKSKKIKALQIYGNDKCSLCGYGKYVGALCFHHIDPTQKDRDITSTKWSKLKLEISKCQLVCFNCHMEIHSGLHLDIFNLERSKTYNAKYMQKMQNTNKMESVRYLGGKCIQCGYDKCLRAMNFHHRQPKDKLFSIGSRRDLLLVEISKELDKCDLLCANCHQERHEISLLQSPDLQT